jgi:hypothetical protein
MNVGWLRGVGVGCLAGVVLMTVPRDRLLRAQAPVVRDSAGIRIVENPSRRSMPMLFALDSTPLLDVGGIEDNPDVEFAHNEGYVRAVVLSDGGLAVIDVTRIHFFDARGIRRKIVGRQGAGPQEFQYLEAICRTRGDTIIVSDNHNRREAVLDRSGSIVRTIPEGDLGGVPFDFCFSDGTFLREKLAGPVTFRFVHLTRVRVDGSTANVIGDFPAQRADAITQTFEIAAAWGTHLYYASPALDEVRIFDDAGKLMVMIRTNDPRTPVTDAEVEHRLATMSPLGTPEAERRARLNRIRAMPHAKVWPAFRDMVVGADGRIWESDYTTRDEPEVYTAYDSTGRIMGRLTLPPRPASGPRPQIISFGTNTVLVRRWDNDGATHLTMYRILNRRM